MDRERTAALLNRVLHATVNSVVQYLEPATPYVPSTCAGRMDDLKRLAAEEAVSAHEIVDLLAQYDGVPQVGVFPYWNVDLNYLDVRFLCRFASRHQVKAIAELQAVLAGEPIDGKVRTLLERLLAQKQAHLEVLNEIGALPGPKVDEERKKKAQPTEPQHVPRPVRPS